MNIRSIVSVAAMAAVLFCRGPLAASAALNVKENGSAALNPTGTIRDLTLIGTTVLDPQGHQLGRIQHVILDTQTGQATFVVLEAVNSASKAAMLVVPYQALRVNFNPADNRQSVTLNLPPDKSSAAPQIQYKQWQLLQNPEFLDQVRNFYQIRAAYYAGSPGTSAMNAPSTPVPMVSPAPPAYYVAPSPPACYAEPRQSTDSGDGLTQDQEDFYNE